MVFVSMEAQLVQREPRFRLSLLHACDQEIQTDTVALEVTLKGWLPSRMQEGRSEIESHCKTCILWKSCKRKQGTIMEGEGSGYEE
jgi:hypothetical protein